MHAVISEKPYVVNGWTTDTRTITVAQLCNHQQSQQCYLIHMYLGILSNQIWYIAEHVECKCTFTRPVRNPEVIYTL